MCGIVGVVRFDGAPVVHAELERMVGAIRHRGPDDWGVWAAGSVGLGNTRLAIIDLSAAGHQPLANESGEVWIAFNGEIYNFAELRTAVQARGHVFRSATDTETIVHLFEESGIEAVDALRGMFALAIWDGRRRELWLARDRLGKKPLYYHADARRLVFGSEIKALLAHPDVPRTLNRKVIPLYLTYGYVPEPETIFAGIRCVPPGTWLRVHDGQIEQRTYWMPPEPVDEHAAPARRDEDWAEALLAQLREAVRLRLISDVPLGAFLSGGLDSSVIVGLMAEVATRPVKTFAIGFAGEPSYDETAHARTVARHFGTEHHEFIVDPHAVELVPELVWHLDQPFGDSSAIPTYLVAKLAREHVTVSLTGDGSDELFAGYERFHAARLARHYQRLPRVAHQSLERLASWWPQGTGYRDVGRRALRFLHAARQPLAEQYLGWVGVMSPELARELVIEQNGDPADHFRRYFRVPVNGDPVPTLLDVNLRSYLPGDLLVKTDRMSMAASLEARSPFLDHRLVEFAATIPPSLKLRRGVGKFILRRAVGDKLPPAILARRKHGFGVPLGRWFRTSLREYLHDTVLAPDARTRALLQPEVVRQLVQEHQSGARDHGHVLWTVLMLEAWQRRFLEAS